MKFQKTIFLAVYCLLFFDVVIGMEKETTCTDKIDLVYFTRGIETYLRAINNPDSRKNGILFFLRWLRREINNNFEGCAKSALKDKDILLNPESSKWNEYITVLTRTIESSGLPEGAPDVFIKKALSSDYSSETLAAEIDKDLDVLLSKQKY